MFWQTLPLLFFCATLAAEPLVLTVDGAVERALEANWQLVNAQETLENAQMQLGLQEGIFGTQWQPITELGVAEQGMTLGTGVTLSRRLRSGTSLSCTPKVGRGYRSLSLNLKQPLFRGLSKAYNEDPIHSARHSVRMNERSLHLSRMAVVMQTIQALYRVAACEAVLDLEEESATHLSRFVQATRLKGRVGIASDMEIYQAEIEWKAVEEARGAAEEKLAMARDVLCTLLVLPSGTEFAVEVPIAEEPISIDVQAAINEALEQRLEVGQGQERAIEAQRKVRIAKHKLLPEVNVVCNYGHGRTGHDWAVGLTSGTDWSRKKEQIAYAQSVTAATAAERMVEECREKIRQDVEQAVRGLYRSEERVAIGKERLKSGEGKVRLARLRVERGLAKTSELVSSEKGFKGARRDLIEAMVDHTLGHYQLLAAQGVLL